MPSDDDSIRRVDADDYVTRAGLAAGRKVFGRYVLEAVLGQGGMGVVWRARDEELGIPVALKFLPEVVARDDPAVDELKEETRNALRLTHPNIVRVHCFEHEGGMAAVSMEYVDGAPLSKLRLAQPGKVFSAEKLAPLVAQACAALGYAHGEAKVVHRDLKPANLLVTPEGRLKVADFGIARSLADTHTRLTGRAAGTSGTLLYMSPQQLLGRKASASDDVYALGATLYELLTGRPPFFTGDIATQVQGVTPPPLAERRSELGFAGEPIPAAWEETVAACLAKDPARRPQTAGEVAARLGLAEAGGTIAGPFPVAGRGPATNARRTRSRMPRVLLLAGLAVLALGAVAYSFWPRIRPARPSDHLVPVAKQPPATIKVPGGGTLTAFTDDQLMATFGETKAKAERGDADAQVNLGQIYAKGDRVSKDGAEAARWYRKAADQGNADGQWRLGVMYATGDGVAKDGAEAARWLRKAADQGNAMAQWGLGIIYDDGVGVPKDSVEAVKWYRKAADGGCAAAQYYLGVMYDHGDGVAKDSVEAVKWYRKAANQGNTDAQFRLGYMYGNGDGVAKDSAEAVRWYRKAADQGDAGGQCNLGFMYENGDGVPKDSTVAVRWYRKAAGQGEAVAQRHLGAMYADGDGVPKDETEALAWCYLAAASGDETAKKNQATLELRIGPQMSLAAQQRSKEILAEIEAAKLRSAGPAVVGAPPADYLTPFTAQPVHLATGTLVPIATGALVPVAPAAAGKPALGTLACETTPTGALVVINGGELHDMVFVNDQTKVERVTPLHGVLPPGEYTLRFELEGYKAAARTVTVEANRTVEVSVLLEKLRGAEEGQAWTVPELNLEMAYIRPGTFTMGSPASETERSSDEGPQTQVTLTKGYWLGKTDVTQAQWEALMGSNPSHFKGADRPVEQVSWDDAMQFCRKLTERERAAGRLPEGFEYTLPTEAQWEYACRAGTTGPYGGDGNLDDMGWYILNSGDTTHPVGQKQANAWGLYDMHGNVWEWCLDWYGNYPGGSERDPTGPAWGTDRVFRGGAWEYLATGCRSAKRNRSDPGIRNNDVGFRLDLAPQVVTGQLQKPELTPPAPPAQEQQATPPKSDSPREQEPPPLGFLKSSGDNPDAFGKDAVKIPAPSTGADNFVEGDKNSQNNGGSGAKATQEVRRQPIPRPRLAQVRPDIPQQRPVGAHNAGQIAVDAHFSQFGDYLQELIDIVQIQWERILTSSSVSPKPSSRVTISFRINSKGQISEILKVEGDAGESGTNAALSALREPAPYRAWTREMVAVLGNDQVITFSFYYW
jgi:TPR repeat protein/formylglycine-generating enzyme required for sulfatase activity